MKKGVNHVLAARFRQPSVDQPPDEIHEVLVDEGTVRLGDTLDDPERPVVRLVDLRFGEPQEEPENYGPRQLPGELGDELALRSAR